MAYRIAHLGHGFAVKTAEAVRVSPVFRDKEAAIDWLFRAEERRAPRERPCLACQQPFLSRGIHDRLCRRCGCQQDDGLGDAQRPVIQKD